VALLAAPVALAAPPKLEAQPTFGKALFSGTWQPITVTVTNRADSPALSGRLVLVVDSRDGVYGLPPVTYTQPVHLPAGQGVSQLRFLVNVPGESPRFVLRLLDEAGRVVQTTEEPLALGPDGALRVLSVGATKPLPLAKANLGVIRQHGTLHYRKTPTESLVPGGMGYEEKHVWTVAVPATVLGEQALDYSAFAIVYLGPEAPVVRLSAEQQKALGRYVRNGGVLVQYSHDEQVRPVGLGTAIQTTKVETEADWVALAHAGVSSSSALSQAMWEEGGEAVLSGSVEAPPFATLAFFLGLYLLAVVPGQYIVLRRLDKREWAWGTTPLLACGFAVAAYQFGSAGRSQAVYHNLSSTIELGTGRGEGSAVVSVGVYSPKRATYTLAVPSAETVYVRPSGYRNLKSATVDLGESGRGLTLTNFAVSQWSMRGAVVRAEVQLGEGVALEFTRQGDQLTGTVTNNTGHPLKDAALLARGVRYFLNTLAPGEQRKVSVMSVKGAAIPLSGYNRTAPGDPDEAILQATCTDPIIPVEIDGTSSTAHRTENTVIVHARVH